jgi:hypothetical protein
VDCRKIGFDGQVLAPATEYRFGLKFQLRFQLPANVLPFALEGGRLMLKMRARAHTVDLSLLAGGKEKPLKHLVSPFGLEVIEIGDKALLPFDDRGQLTMNVDVSNVQGEAARDLWNLDWIGLDVRGRAKTREGDPVAAPQPK